MSKHTELGVKGEILALEFLEKKGYTILEINWHFEKIEVDIIARQMNTLVIVEVKTRSGDMYGFPEDAVGIEKQRNLALASEEYLERNNLDMDVRFDVISITFKGDKPGVYHIQDAFFPYEI